MLIHLHSQAIVRHGFEEPPVVRHWFKPNGGGEGNDDAKDPGGDRGQ